MVSLPKVKLLNRHIPILLILIAIVCFFALGGGRWLTWNTLVSHHAILSAWVAQHFLWMLLAYVVIYTLIVSLSLPFAAGMSVLGGLLFGQAPATLAVIFAATFGATLLFWSARMASEDWLRRRLNPKWQTIQAGLQKNAFFYLLSIRMIPVIPFFAVNLVCALLQLPLRSFVAATCLGIIPGSYIYVSIGVALQTVAGEAQLRPDLILEPKIFWALVGFALLSLLPVIVKRFRKS